jgi:hypothetical protein
MPCRQAGYQPATPPTDSAGRPQGWRITRESGDRPAMRHGDRVESSSQSAGHAGDLEVRHHRRFDRDRQLSSYLREEIRTHREFFALALGNRRWALNAYGSERLEQSWLVRIPFASVSTGVPHSVRDVHFIRSSQSCSAERHGPR